MEPEVVQKIRDGGLLDVIRVRTAMYTGERTLSSVAHFLSGFGFAHTVLQIPQRSMLAADFHDWVAYRLHFRESTMGYRKMILERVPDESAALDRFFELVDEHQKRQGRLVATVRSHCSNRDTSKAELAGDEVREDAIEEIKIVVYTRDPGFFLESDTPAAGNSEQRYFRPSFCPSLSWLRDPFKPVPKFVKVFDTDTYDRLLQEEKAFEQSLKGHAEIWEKRAEAK